MSNRDFYKDEFDNYHEVEEDEEMPLDGLEDDEQEHTENEYDDDSFEDFEEDEDHSYDDEDEAYLNEGRKEYHDIDED